MGPLYLGAAAKIRSLSPIALLERSRHVLVSTSIDEIGSARGIPAGLDGAEIKRRVLEAIDQAEVFLSKAPSAWAEGLPVDDAGRPVTINTSISARSAAMRKGRMSTVLSTTRSSEWSSAGTGSRLSRSSRHHRASSS